MQAPITAIPTSSSPRGIQHSFRSSLCTHNTQVQWTARGKGLVEEGDRVVAAVSGGTGKVCRLSINVWETRLRFGQANLVGVVLSCSNFACNLHIITSTGRLPCCHQQPKLVDGK
eukprot:scaffold137628_cov30-Prasinocladus_malaysianus.AAC.1